MYSKDKFIRSLKGELKDSLYKRTPFFAVVGIFIYLFFGIIAGFTNPEVIGFTILWIVISLIFSLIVMPIVFAITDS